MFDIHFFRQTNEWKKRILQKKITMSPRALAAELEKAKSPIPSVFNIETTNNCNMKCVMCPRTELMDRPIKTMDMDDFRLLLDQVRPHTEQELAEFWRFISEEYGIESSERSENSFYFHIISRCLTLHGYGEPLLDPLLAQRVREASARNIPTYFSCVPANLTVKRAVDLMQAGLTVLKVSIDALDDESQKAIRGSRNNFKESFDTILEILAEKKRLGLKTVIVPTMIAFSSGVEAQELHDGFLRLWEGHDVFAYVKSQDNRWLYEKDEGMENRSHYEKQYCEFPFTSLTVMAEGSVVPCTQDYNSEMPLGNIREDSLEKIWNNESYRQFREWHVTGAFPAGHKCISRCDQKKIFQYLAPEARIAPTEPRRAEI
jgi:radical SAM protein with 4Fe4S-binding SPASM domain